jgi:hypothetical protein
MGLQYNRSGDVIEIIERDASNSKVGSWKFNTADKKLANSVLSRLLKKYNFHPEIAPEESINAKEKDKMEFLNLDVDW